MLETAQDEANPRLGKHMTRLLMDKGYQRRLSSTEKAETNAVFEARFPQRLTSMGSSMPMVTSSGSTPSKKAKTCFVPSGSMSRNPPSVDLA